MLIYFFPKSGVWPEHREEAILHTGGKIQTRRHPEKRADYTLFLIDGVEKNDPIRTGRDYDHEHLTAGDNE